MNRVPKISVLIPSFNYAHYLPAAIQSVLSQSFVDLELIITDDCSTDGSRGIAEEWTRIDDRVAVVAHDTNRGLSAARNSGFAKSSGSLIALCDADDIWSVDKLKVQLECFHKQPDVGVVHSDAIVIDSKGNPTGQRYSSRFHGKDQKCSGRLFDQFCLRNFVCNSSVVLKRECLTYAGGFDPRLRSLEDWVCWARVSRRYCFGYIDHPLLQYRVHPANLSTQITAMASLRVIAMSMLLDESGDITPQIRSKMLYSIGMSHIDLAEWKAACRTFRSSAKEDVLNLRSWVRCGQTFLESIKQTAFSASDSSGCST
jgi:glycosyltransferase involved in cell wall biosynthesis